VFVSVIGGGRCSQQEARIAEEVGAELARRGVTLVCGGLSGVMEAACRGSRSEGGTTIGIIPGSRREEANPYVDIPIVTTLGEARNIIVVCSGQAVIAIGGEYGTLSEIAHALRNGIPVVGLNTWSLCKHGLSDTLVTVAQDARDAVDKVMAIIGSERGSE